MKRISIYLAAISILHSAPCYSYEEKSALFFGNYTENFVSRWGFQSKCQYSFDPRLEAFPTSADKVATFDPKAIKPGDLIFVRDVATFYKELHPLITSPYIMITAGDYKDAVKDEFMAFLDDEKIIAWFCVHPSDKTHPKFYAIPLGVFQNKEFYEKRTDLTKLFARWRHAKKEKLLLSNFRVRPKLKPERDDLSELFKSMPFCHISKPLPFLEYMKEMSQFKFVLSPRGIAPDTYRTWEALLVGSIPIVQSSHLDELYKDLPILIINSYTELTAEFLETKYNELCKKKFNIEKLFMEYWWDKIAKVQEAFMKSSKKRKN